MGTDGELHEDGYPAEWVWVPTGKTAPDGHDVTRCRLHGIEFSRVETFAIGTAIVHGNCPECHRAPPRGEMPSPDYWKPSSRATAALGALTCAYHECSFPADACCVACMEEDEPKLLEELRRVSRPKYVRADGSPVETGYPSAA